jgi:hypothetical protein
MEIGIITALPRLTIKETDVGLFLLVVANTNLENGKITTKVIIGLQGSGNKIAL